MYYSPQSITFIEIGCQYQLYLYLLYFKDTKIYIRKNAKSLNSHTTNDYTTDYKSQTLFLLEENKIKIFKTCNP